MLIAPERLHGLKICLPTEHRITFKFVFYAVAVYDSRCLGRTEPPGADGATKITNKDQLDWYSKTTEQN